MENVYSYIILIITLFLFVYTIIQKPRIFYKQHINKHIFNNNEYVIYEINNVISPIECKILIDTSTPKLKRSGVISKNPISEVRTSYNTFLHLRNESSQVQKILNRINDLTMKLSNKPVENQEPLQVVKYTKDQYYKEHYDCCVPFESPLCKTDNENNGFRHSTLLIYLNDVEEGGETEFPIINYKFKPKLGSAIYFFNLNKNETNFHPSSKHAGLPPIKGEKWVCNKWIRTKKYM